MRSALIVFVFSITFIAGFCISDQPVRQLQSSQRVTDVGDYTLKPAAYILSLRRFLALNEQTFRWSKEWFPKGLRNAWFATAGQALQESFNDYISDTLISFSPKINALINQHLSSTLQQSSFGKQELVVGDYNLLWSSTIFGNLSTNTDIKQGTEKLGRTLFTQFTINALLESTTILNGTLIAIVKGIYESTENKTDTGSIMVKASIHFNDIAISNLVHSAKFAVNAFKLFFGYSHYQFMNTCLEDLELSDLNNTEVPLPEFDMGDITIEALDGTNKGTCSNCRGFKSCEIMCEVLPDQIVQSLSVTAIPWQTVAKYMGLALPQCETGVSDGTL